MMKDDQVGVSRQLDFGKPKKNSRGSRSRTEVTWKHFYVDMEKRLSNSIKHSEMYTFSLLTYKGIYVFLHFNNKLESSSHTPPLQRGQYGNNNILKSRRCVEFMFEFRQL